MKLVKGREGDTIAIICECNGLKSSLSQLITVRNKIREVQIMEEF